VAHGDPKLVGIVTMFTVPCSAISRGGFVADISATEKHGGGWIRYYYRTMMAVVAVAVAVSGDRFLFYNYASR